MWEKLKEFAIKAGGSVVYAVLLLYYTMKLNKILYQIVMSDTKDYMPRIGPIQVCKKIPLSVFSHYLLFFDRLTAQ
jgi:hypothetical protein